MSNALKSVRWVGSSYKDLVSLPKSVRKTLGFAIDQAQRGGAHMDAKPLKGFGHAGVVEVSEDNQGSTYRAVYTVRFPGVIYVLHVFQKKSKRGIATARRDIALIRQRVREAQMDFSNREKC